MNAGSITISTELDNKELETQYAATIKKIRSLTDKINTAQAKRSPAADQSAAVAAELDAAKAQLDYMKSGQEFFTASAIQQQEASVKSIQKDWNKAQTSVEKYDAQIAAASSELSVNEEKAGTIASEMVAAGKSTSLFGDGLDAVGMRLDRVFTRIKKLATRILFFSVITMGLRSVREWLGNVVGANKEASSAVSQLKAALLTLAQPLVNVVIPAFTAFVRILTQVVLGIARVISILSGTTVEQSENSAQALNNETTALDKTGKAAKKAAKSLAAFDEINQITSSDSSTSASATSGSASPDFAGLKEFNTADYQKKVDEITAIISGALLALGAILFFTGAKPLLGLGLMALGAIGLAAEAKEHWGDTSGVVQKEIDAITLVLGGAALAIGAILAFSGTNLQLGIALMAIGAVALATEAALHWETLETALQGPLAGVAAVVSGALVALGAVLAFSGSNVPLGIALMAAGAVGLISIAALNWDTMKTALQSPIGSVTSAVSLALLAVGAILAFSGANLPLGIAMMAVGAVGLATAIVANWETITTALRGPIGTITTLVSGALLVLGAVLAFSGANVPLGIAMMALGGAGLATALPLNWDYILDKMKAAWNNIKTWWQTEVLTKLSTIPTWFKDNLINPLLGFVESFVNFFIGGINDIIGAINSMISAAANALAVVGIAVEAPQIPTIPEIAIPRLAMGAVIPPNREFMAVLGDQKHGTNIEAPEDLIRKIVREESGGGNSQILQAILAAIKEGKVIALDRRAFGKVVANVYDQETSRVGVKLLT